MTNEIKRKIIDYVMLNSTNWAAALVSSLDDSPHPLSEERVFEIIQKGIDLLKEILLEEKLSNS